MSGPRIVLLRVGPGKWTASCSQWRSLAQGESAEEALKNLTELIHAYPDLVAKVTAEFRKTEALTDGTKSKREDQE